MFSQPATYVRLSQAITNVVTDYTVVAAPGAGFRHRIIQWRVQFLRAAGVNSCDGSLRDGLGGSVLWPWILAQPDQWYSESQFHFPGMLLGENKGIVTTATSTVAAITILFAVAYYTDRIS